MQAILIPLVFVFLIGACVGSFLNVVVWRLPRGESLVKPPSHCPKCNTHLAWFDNVPILGWIMLRGKCRYCSARISWRYPLVELLTGALFGYAVLKFGLTLQALKLCIFGAILIALIFMDLADRILADEFTIGGTVAGLVFSWFVLLRRMVMSTIRTARTLIGIGITWSAVSIPISRMTNL